MVRSCSCTLTNWLGNSGSSALLKRALARTVPVWMSTWLSSEAKAAGVQHGGAGAVERRDRHLAMPAPRPCCSSGTWSCGTANSTSIGDICVITAMPLASLGADHVADVHRAQADAAGDRRHDAGVAQVQRAPCLRLALVGHHGAFQLLDQRGLGVDFLARDRVLRQQGAEALQRHARAFPAAPRRACAGRWPAAAPSRTGAGRSSASTWPALHQLAFVEEHLAAARPTPAAARVTVACRHHRAQRFQRDRHVDLLGRGRRRPWSSARRAARRRPAAGAPGRRTARAHRRQPRAPCASGATPASQARRAPARQ